MTRRVVLNKRDQRYRTERSSEVTGTVRCNGGDDKVDSSSIPLGKL